jgi:hypothetical protein
MNEMRLWFDKHGVQPVEFKTTNDGNAGIIFQVKFQSADEAALFNRAFS